jgi:hypothetical protein
MDFHAEKNSKRLKDQPPLAIGNTREATRLLTPAENGSGIPGYDGTLFAPWNG